MDIAATGATVGLTGLYTYDGLKPVIVLICMADMIDILTRVRHINLLKTSVSTCVCLSRLLASCIPACVVTHESSRSLYCCTQSCNAFPAGPGAVWRRGPARRPQQSSEA